MKINGRQIADKILVGLRKRVKKLKEKGTTPHLGIILIGNDPASIAYVKQKVITAEKIGIKTSLFQYSDSISTKDLLSHLFDLNHLKTVHGIIVQRPLPSHIDTDVISKAIDPKKDIDAFHPKSNFEPPIFMAVLEILNSIFLRSILIQGCSFINWLKSKKVVVIGKGETGGKPIINMFRKMNIQPEIIDSKTENPKQFIKNADIIISAVGKPNVVKPETIKKNSILISIGLSKGKGGKLHGDYEEKEIKNIASFYTPTPGGVGPVNVAKLLENLIVAAED